MRTGESRRKGAALAICLCAALCASGAAEGAQQAEAAPRSESGGADAAVHGAYKVRSAIDWKARVLRLGLELDLAAAGLKMPQGRLEAQRMIERDLAGIAKDAVFGVQADSYRRIGDAVEDGSFDAERLVELPALLRPESSSFSKDMRYYRATYSLGLDSLSALFLNGGSPSPIRPPLDEGKGRVYSGLVIYAKGKLPVHGEGVEDRARPCLFPRVYDEGMRLVLDRTRVEPEVLAEEGSRGGVLGYASALGAEAGARVGDDPLRIKAVALFGDDRTDYVISREDALRILSGESNRKLLAQGKVVVILDLN